MCLYIDVILSKIGSNVHTYVYLLSIVDDDHTRK